MNLDGYHNSSITSWASQNIRGQVKLRLMFNSRLGTIFVYLLLFSVPAAFFALGIFFLVLGSKDRSVTFGPIVFGFLTAIPAGIIAMLGAYVRRGFATSLDTEGVNGRMGQKFPWAKLRYVDHVTKHVRAGGVSRKVKDNQLELVFEGGKVIIPPLIHDRQAVWNLINSIPVEVRDDGVTRANPGANAVATPEDFMAFLESLPPK